MNNHHFEVNSTASVLPQPQRLLGALVQSTFGTFHLTYRSELSLSKRSRELVDAAPGDVLRKLSAPFVDSDSDVRESILFIYLFI